MNYVKDISKVTHATSLCVPPCFQIVIITTKNLVIKLRLLPYRQQFKIEGYSSQKCIMNGGK
jgi:hypothetical protein